MYSPDIPLRSDLPEAHAASWRSIGEAGAFWTGSERVQMVAHARAAMSCELCGQRKSALSPSAVNGEHDGISEGAELPPVLVDAIHRIRSDPGRLTRSVFDRVIAAGVSEPGYVEMVSVVNSSVIIDTLHRSLGLSLPELPQVCEGEASGVYNTAAVDAGAWVPVMDADQDLLDTGMPSVPNIVRSMGLVPGAVQLFFQTFRPHYALVDIPLSISQAQAEFVASRVSALNECFYWTTAHTMRLRGSGEQEGREYDLSAVTSASGDGGVDAGETLRALTEAAIRGEWDLLDRLRVVAFEKMGEQETVDALTVAAAFNGITRVADSTGIPLDDAMAEATTSMRATTGIEQFAYAQKSARYDS